MYSKREHIQTALAKIRRGLTLRLIRVCTVCQNIYTLGNGIVLNFYILEDFENASPYFLHFSYKPYMRLKSFLAGFNVQTQNWYESVVNLTALSRDAADDVTWVHTTSSTFLHS